MIMKIPACDHCQTALNGEECVLENNIQIETMEGRVTLPNKDGSGIMKLPAELDFCDSHCMEEYFHGLIAQLHVNKHTSPQASQAEENGSGKE